MAAKEKSEVAQKKKEPTPPPPPADLLSMNFDAPSTEPPPPSYATNFLQPPPLPPAPAAPTIVDMPPPAFEHVENTFYQMDFPPPPPIDLVMPPPPIESFAPPPPIESMAPPAASAPSFEDLLGSQQHHAPQPIPPPAAPPAIDEDILAALDPAEREVLLQEQKQIMEQIEREKTNNVASSAAARAMAFDQRSSAAVAQVAATYDRPSSRPASRPTRSQTSGRGGEATVNLGAGEQVPLHGQEKTQQAIKDGTAVVVQCINCQNWMQVTNSASLMFCPTCQVVSPVEQGGSADMESAAQMSADAQLAEKLQNEEYQKASGGSERPRRAKPQQQQQQQADSSSQSWYDWFTGVPTKPPPAAERHVAEIRRAPGLVAAQTGEEVMGSRSRSYDESEGLISGGGARVADQKSMFACVTDSISTAATQMTAMTLPSDQEGNVHGVDSSSLLAMPDVSRQRE